ncbi:MAG: methyl-accepting chemotaxis protein [Deltaproteobacteria bacterium]|jgi:methyl-accepting chemotaxis protein|nr:methyl-accepting chemotaxis protein [Deltaproteobacteria bacterium]
MQAKTHRRKLRSYFINKQIQLRLAITNLMYMILVVSVVILTVLTPFYLDSFESLELCRQYLSAKLFIVLLERLAIAVGVILLVAFIHQIIMSHKFCGPLVNFANSFKKMSKGDLSRRIYLRRYDFLKEEARQLNEMIDGFSNKIIEIKNENNLLVATLENAADTEANQEVKPDAIREALSRATACQKLLSNFQLSEEFNQEQNSSSE